MSKFTKEEVDALKAGGNKRAKAVWLAKYDESKMPPIKANEVNKIKEKMEKTYERKEWYDENGKPKKKKSTKTRESTAKEEPEAPDQDDGSEEKDEKPKASSKPKAAVKSANVMEDLLSFDNTTSAKANDDDDDGNPFDSEEEQPDDDEPENLFAQAPASVKAPVSNSGSAAILDIAGPAAGSPEASSVDLIVRTLKEIGMKHKFPREKMLILVDEALFKVGLKAAGAVSSTPHVTAPAPASAQAPVKSAPAAQKLVATQDIFAEAEQATVFSNPVSPLQPVNPTLATRGPASGPPIYGGASAPVPVAAAANPFLDEEDNPFGSPSRSPPNPFGGRASAPAPAPAGNVGAYPQPAPGVYNNPYPGYPAQPYGGFQYGQPAAPVPFSNGPQPYALPPGFGPAPTQPAFVQPTPAAAQPPAQPKKDDMFKEFGMF